MSDTTTRCMVCRKKNTLQEIKEEEQTAMQCTYCSWLDPSSIKDIKTTETKSSQ